MKNAIIVYDSVYGNTERVARALAQGLEKSGTVKATLFRADVADVGRLTEYDILIVGAPTHAWRASVPIKKFLGKIGESALKGKKAFAFDTKMKGRFAGSGASRDIENSLSKLGANIVKERMSAIVKGKEGPLEEDTESKFTGIGLEIAKKIQ
jgi:flavorubredoxin